ncbi:MAG: heavy metal translocating P-type ATPase [Candidatus Merdivicinus sp.]|jgi:heavy metal translocating P-type ATPase
MKQKFRITGMSCAACSSHVEKSVRKLPGIEEVTVSLLTNSMTVQYDEQKVSANQIMEAVQQGGYGALPDSPQGKRSASVGTSTEKSSDSASKSMKVRLIGSFALLIPLFYLAMGHMMGWPLPAIMLGDENLMIFAFTQFLLCLPILILNRKYFIGGFLALWHRSPNMDSLIAIGSSAAVVYGVWAIYQIGWGMGHGDWEMVHHYAMDLYFETAGMILTLITLGKFLESRAKGKTSAAITRLMELAPKTAFAERDGKVIEIPTEEVQRGDILHIKPGQSIPVDGILVEGNTAVDESALTGESIPVDKQVGDHLTGASVNKNGFIKMRAEKVGEDTTLAQIIRLVEEASASKAPIARLADRVSGVFVPIVIGIALVSALIWLLLGYEPAFAISIGIAVLVVSCPCALGLATPTAIMVGTGKGAENGILIKSGEALETAHLADTVVLDKTGTVTEGKLQVTDIIPLAGQKEQEFLALAAGMEEHSEHPLGEAVVQEAVRRKLQTVSMETLESIPGKGIRAHREGSIYLAGNRKFMEENQISLAKDLPNAVQLEEDGKTVLFFAKDGKILGMIAEADAIKVTSAQAVQELHDLGLNVVMLTGDSQRTAEAIQKRAGIETAIAQVLPDEKEAHVRAFQEKGKKVIMVGDGINDAPALARADVGIAIGTGTDVAIESADIVLMRGDLRDVVTAIRLSRAVIRNIKQNLFWALCYNTLGIPLAAGLFFIPFALKLNPMFGAAAMSLSSVCVVTNALRLRFFKPLPSACPLPVAESKIEEESALPVNRTQFLKIEGMMCEHCVNRVLQALESLDGVKAEVSLENGTANVTVPETVSNEQLKNAVEDAGYTVLDIS